MVNRSRANGLAAAAFALALIVGFVVLGDLGEAGKAATVVTKEIGGDVPGTKKTTTVKTSKRGGDDDTTTTTEMTAPSSPPPTETTTTTGTGAQSTIERLAGEDGISLLQILVLLLGAFLVAALVQRVALGQ